MTVYVDDLHNYGFTDWRRGRWAHMWSDNIEDLHKMANEIGLKPEWFQNRPHFPHYDLRPGKYRIALDHGARIHSLGKWLKETNHTNGE